MCIIDKVSVLILKTKKALLLHPYIDYKTLKQLAGRNALL